MSRTLILPALRDDELYAVLWKGDDGVEVLVGVAATREEVMSILGDDMRYRLADEGYCCAHHMREQERTEEGLRATIEKIGVHYEVGALVLGSTEPVGAPPEGETRAN